LIHPGSFYPLAVFANLIPRAVLYGGIAEKTRLAYFGPGDDFRCRVEEFL
jgi:hypothetical protein